MAFARNILLVVYLIGLFHLSSEGRNKTLNANSQSKPIGMYFKSVWCNVSEAIAYQNYSCFAKSYSRTISTANAMWTYKNPVPFLLVRLRCRSLDIYQLNNIFVCVDRPTTLLQVWKHLSRSASLPKARMVRSNVTTRLQHHVPQFVPNI